MSSITTMPPPPDMHTKELLHERNVEAIQSAPPVRSSPWTRRQQVQRLLWQTIGYVFWCLLPPFRARLLRCFGATIGPGCTFSRRVQIIIPWNLHLGRNVKVSHHVILYALGPLTIGDDVTVDCRAHLCAGSHDVTHPRFPQTRPPISIGSGSYIGIDAYVAPGVTLGNQCVVWHRASVYRSFPDHTHLRGNPARPVDPSNPGPEAPAL